MFRFDLISYFSPNCLAATDITISSSFSFFYNNKKEKSGVCNSTTNVSTVRRCCYLTGQRCFNSATRVGLMSRMRLWLGCCGMRHRSLSGRTICVCSGSEIAGQKIHQQRRPLRAWLILGYRMHVHHASLRFRLHFICVCRRRRILIIKKKIIP